MSQLQPNQHAAFQALHRWMRETFERMDFMPFDSLSTHLESNDYAVLNDLLDALYQGQTVPPPPRPKEVVTNYSRVFCILVSINRAHFLQRFMEDDQLSDKHLPLNERPRQFPLIPAQIPPDGCAQEDEFFEAFCNAQWKFCPPEIEDNCSRRLDSRTVLPFISKRLIGEGSSATIHAIKIHPWYDRLPDDSNASSRTYALKTYHGKDADKSWENEVQAFQKVLRLRPPGSPNVIDFCTAFKHGVNCHIILEYADRGSLEQYFRANAPPKEGVDIARLWKRILGLIRGLSDLHNVDGDEMVWHQDLKPANILVLSDPGTGTSPYASIFKIGDLGTSHSKRIISSNGDRSDRDAQGTRTYGAPECYRSDSVWGGGPIKVPVNVDVFSLGCILSEVAVWIAGGESWLLEYRDARRQAISQIPDFHDGDCFHDGISMLPVVRKWHLDIISRQNSTSDFFTPAFIPMIEEMLQDAAHRGEAKEFCTKAHRNFCASLHDFKVQQPHVVIPNDVLPNLSRDQSLRIDPPVLPEEYDQMQTVQVQAGTSSSGSNIRFESTSLANGKANQRYPTESKGKTSLGGHRTISTPLPITNKSFGGRQEPLQIRRFSEQPKTFERTPVFEPYPYFGLDTSVNSSSAGPSFAHYSQADAAAYSATTPTSPSRPSTRLPLAYPSTLQPKKPLSKVMTPNAAIKYMSRLEAQTCRDLSKKHRWARNTFPLDDPVLKGLEDRDSVIIIDDSESMRKHWPDMTELVSIIAWILKQFDKDGLDLYFASSFKKYHADTSTKVVNYLDQRRSDENDWGHIDMSLRLDQVLSEYRRRIKQQKTINGITRQLNVYVFTDANWTAECNIIPAIDEMVLTLSEERFSEKQVGIQFVSFGDDPNCIGRLRLVDNGLKTLERPYDIVDTTPSTGNLYKMIRGAIDRDYDYDSEDSNDNTHSPG